MSKINTTEFYKNFSGHLIEHLAKMIDGKSFIERLRSYNGKNRKVIFLAGDSSLDNKHWPRTDSVESKLCNKPPINGYEDVLIGNYCVPDVAYQINQTLIDNGLNDEYVCINTAIEATKLEQRFNESTNEINLLQQDKFICDNIQTDDILIVSISGNDFALNATKKIKLEMEKYVKAYEEKNDELIRKVFEVNSVFYNLIKVKMERYIKELCSKNKPSQIILCMIYYPAIDTETWAKDVLILFKYKQNPRILHEFISELYKLISQDIQIEKGMIPGNEINIIDPCPLYEILNGSDKNLYIQAVEPSIAGGRIMANRFVDQIKIYKYIRNYFIHYGNIELSMTYFRDQFLNYYDNHDKFIILINELLEESKKLNNNKTDKYYHKELKRYINIILKDKGNTEDYFYLVYYRFIPFIFDFRF